jgi:hypothetical protein
MKWLLGLVALAAAAQAPPPAGYPGKAPQGPAAQITTFEAQPSSLRPGQKTVLRWVALNTYSIRIEPGIGAVPARGSREIAPAATTTYTLTVTGSGGSRTQSITVTVAGTVAIRSSAAGASKQRAVPKLGDGKPDLSGVYMAGRNIRVSQQAMLKPGAERFRVVQKEDDLGQGAMCLPPGVPGSTLSPYPLQIVQRPDVVVIIYEAYNLFRIIPIGRDHPDDIDPTWMGHSVGRWEGDTLVVDVRGFNDQTQVGGFRHTEDLHVIERYRRTGFDTITYEATVEDANVFSAPLKYAGNFELHPEWEIGEYVCAENNKDYGELFKAK